MARGEAASGLEIAATEGTMALFGKERERIEGTGLVSPPTTTPGFSETARGEGMTTMTEPQRNAAPGTDAFLGKGSQVTGKIILAGTGRIEGKVEGEIAAQDTLVIGDTAVVNAQVSGETIVIHGRVTGDVTARQKLELRTGSKVSGNISAPRLIVEEGATFEGQCTMGGTPAGKAAEKTDVAVLLREKKHEDPAHRPGAGAVAHP
jgi:cytoskeletal protein CcmA (bactofilin family)